MVFMKSGLCFAQCNMSWVISMQSYFCSMSTLGMKEWILPTLSPCTNPLKIKHTAPVLIPTSCGVLQDYSPNLLNQLSALACGWPACTFIAFHCNATVFGVVAPFFELSFDHCTIAKGLLNLLNGLSLSITKVLAKLDAISFFNVFSHHVETKIWQVGEDFHLPSNSWKKFSTLYQEKFSLASWGLWNCCINWAESSQNTG